MSLDALADVNYVAVVVAAVAYFAVGGLWYSPLLFARQWIAASGVTPQPGVTPWGLFALSFVTGFVAALALAVIARVAGGETVGDGIVLGLVAGIGFSLTSLVVTQAFETRPLALHFINGGYHLVGLTVAGVIVTVWS